MLTFIRRGIMLLVVLLLAGYAVYRVGWQASDKSESRVQPSIIATPKAVSITMGSAVQQGDYQLISLPPLLADSEIHAIVVDGDLLWLGTDKGLVKINDDQYTLYRQFTQWPFEWARDLVLTPHGIALQLHVAMGNTGGEPAGSYLFDPHTETWTYLGANVLAQAWLFGSLYQAGAYLVVRSADNQWQPRKLDALCHRRPSSLAMVAIQGELWITGDGTTLDEQVDHRFGCGVTRFNPQDESLVTYTTADGLNNDIGWDIGANNDAVYVSHSVKHSYLSQWLHSSGQWRALPVSGSGNHILVDENVIWLAKANPRNPLQRIDMAGNRSRSYSPLSENEYVSALAAQGPWIWLGIVEKQWIDGTYIIRSRLARVARTLRSD